MFSNRVVTTTTSSSSSSSSASSSTSAALALNPIVAPLRRNEQNNVDIVPDEESMYDRRTLIPRARLHVAAAVDIARGMFVDPEIQSRLYAVTSSILAHYPEFQEQQSQPQSDTNSLVSSNFSSLNDLDEFADVPDEHLLVSAPTSPVNRALSHRSSRASSSNSGYASVESDFYDPAPDYINNGPIIEEIDQSSVHSPQLNNGHRQSRPPFEAVLHHYRRLQFPASRVLLHPPVGIVGMFISWQNPNSIPLSRQVIYRAPLYDQSVGINNNISSNSNDNFRANAQEQPAQVQQEPQSHQDPFEVPPIAEPGVIKQIVEKLYRVINDVYAQLFRSRNEVIVEHELEQVHATQLSGEARHRRNIRKQKHEEKRREAAAAFENNLRNATLAGLLVLSGAMFYRLLRISDAQVAKSFKREFWVAFLNNVPSIFQAVH